VSRLPNRLPVIKYLGSKRLLIPYIEGIVATLPGTRPPHTAPPPRHSPARGSAKASQDGKPVRAVARREPKRLPGKSGVRTACDLFAGTTRVGQALKRMGLSVISNDTACYSEVFGRCYIEADATRIAVSEVKEVLRELGSLPARAGYFTETFCIRSRFFQPANGARIDAVREGIDEMNLAEPMRSIALTSLIEAADRVDSTTGLQMAYLKEWAPRSGQPLELRVPKLIPGTGQVFREDASELVKRLPPVDLLYLDPPYNQHSYFSNYHIWVSLVRNDRPEVYGKARKRVDCRTTKSRYNFRKGCLSALADVVRQARARFLIVSFNDEGFVPRDELEAVLSERGEVVRLDIPYKRYVGAQIGIYNPKGERVGEVSHLTNTEHLFVVGEGVTDLASQWDFVPARTSQEPSPSLKPWIGKGLKPLAGPGCLTRQGGVDSGG